MIDDPADGDLAWLGHTNFAMGQWGKDTVVYRASATLPDEPCAAVLLFPFYGDRVVLADNVERGWCIPAGGVEPGESPEHAMHREAMEEAGLTIGRMACIGWYVLSNPAIAGDRRVCPTFIGEVQHIGDWTDREEVRAVQMVNIEDVADQYYRWDTLMAQVFSYADQMRKRLFASGVSLDAFMSQR